MLHFETLGLMHIFKAREMDLLIHWFNVRCNDALSVANIYRIQTLLDLEILMHVTFTIVACACFLSYIFIFSHFKLIHS